MGFRTILLFLVFSVFPLQSQKIVTINHFPLGELPVELYNSEYAGILGSPFLSDTFSTGKILLTTGEVITQIKLKFDICSQQLMVLTKDSILIPDMYYIDAFEIDSLLSKGTEYYKRINFRKTINYYQVAEKGRAFLYVKKSKNIKKSSISEFKYNESFFLVVDNGSFQKLKNSKKGVISAFPNNHYYLELFINSHQIDINSLADLRKLVAYFNRLK